MDFVFIQVDLDLLDHEEIGEKQDPRVSPDLPGRLEAPGRTDSAVYPVSLDLPDRGANPVWPDPQDNPDLLEAEEHPVNLDLQVCSLTHSSGTLNNQIPLS